MVNFCAFWALYLRFMRIILIALTFTQSPYVFVNCAAEAAVCSLINIFETRPATVPPPLMITGKLTLMWVSITTTRPKDGVCDCYLKPARYTDMRDKRTIAYSNDFPVMRLVVHLIVLARGVFRGCSYFLVQQGVCPSLQGVGRCKGVQQNPWNRRHTR